MKNATKRSKPAKSSKKDPSSSSEISQNRPFQPENTTQLPETPLKTPYQIKNEQYTNEGMNNYTLQFLRKMANNPKIPVHMQGGLFSGLLYVCKLLHLNEVEICQWSLLFENVLDLWEKGGFDQTIILLITGYQSKVFSKRC